MKLIVGLGNPGQAYQGSRHNLGFSVIKSLARSYRIILKKESAAFSLSAQARVDSDKLILAMPLTFMNLSGIAVSALLKKYKLDLSGLLVVCDDLDLQFGRLKIRAKGSSGGHRGLQSIIDALENREFARLRLGIGRPPKLSDSARYVLSPFNKQEKSQLKELVEKAADCCRTWLEEGTEKTMAIFNRGPALCKRDEGEK